MQRKRRIPLSITSPTTDQAENRPGPVAITRPTSGNAARTRSAQRAAQAAWSVDLPASGSVSTNEPSGSACTRAPCVLASSVSSASTIDTAGAPDASS